MWRLKHFCLDMLHSVYYLQSFLRNKAVGSTAYSLRKQDNRVIFILANGPSLKQDIHYHTDFLSQHHTLMMNHSVTESIHQAIRPKYHILMDSVYFLGDTFNIMSQADYQKVALEVQEVFTSFEQLTYPISLFVPNIWQDRVKIKNPFVDIQTFGIAKFRGFAPLAHWLFQRALALPSFCNVLIPSIICSIAMGYKTIYLLGCDHDWFRGYFVDSNNTLHIDYKHFYDEDQNISSLEKLNLCDLLFIDSEISRAYHIIHRLFESISIINLSSHSAIDAFPRSTLDRILTGGGDRVKLPILILLFTCFFYLLKLHYSTNKAQQNHAPWEQI